MLVTCMALKNAYPHFSPSSTTMKDMIMIRFAIDPDKVAKPADTKAAEKASVTTDENAKAPAKPRKAAAKRAVEEDDDKKLL